MGLRFLRLPWRHRHQVIQLARGHVFRYVVGLPFICGQRSAVEDQHARRLDCDELLI